ncbi:hypothetical protein ALGA_4287 [Labilibaculum antarcticum]|uniref:Uncharacterized protein n=1 Tax=Labilibaculum antarcticum TaxID=1717717 RepID=A0A1Y1CQ77_9BACT|nr:hypothetical protein ALGA_4287 [Labilibaculum antarcticum]
MLFLGVCFSGKNNKSVQLKDLAFVGENNQWTNETGDFKILIGDHSKASKFKKFYYNK